MEFLRSVWDTLEERLQLHQNRVLQLLLSKLHEALAIFDGTADSEKDEVVRKTVVGKMGKLKRAKFAMSVRDCLVKTVQELERWQSVFDPSWYILIRVHHSAIDKQLALRQVDEHAHGSLSILGRLRASINAPSDTQTQKRSVFVEESILQPERFAIRHSQSQSAILKASKEMVLMDSIRPDERLDITAMTRDIRDLARNLYEVDCFTFGLLSCLGVIKVTGTERNITGFDFVFSIPKSLSNPRSLRSILLAPGSKTSLNERFALAKLLARSVFFMHTSSFVHKNIRPETIVVFQDGTSKIGKPFLVGFEKFRVDTTHTHRLGDDLWERNLYRHPQRQGLRPEEDFIMQHDIYSLGVVLLEIGLQTSFVRLTPRPIDDKSDTAGNNESSEGISQATPTPMLKIADLLSLKNMRKKADAIKDRFIAIANEQLPCAMGQRYTDVVISCLTCLDKDNGFGDQSEFEDQDGILVGVRYIEKVSLESRRSAV